MFGSARRVLIEQKVRSPFKRPHDLVFPTVVGTPHRPADWAREFLGARARAGLRETLRLHDLRHYAVSRLVEQGANVPRLQGGRPCEGERHPDVYAHLFEGGLAEAAERFDRSPARRNSGSW